jgi:glycosyltransferase involved in cell wall biosynthesis
MPIYNGEAYLATALDSIVAQAETDIEIIAVDGDSTDNTLSILRSYQNTLPLQILHRERTSNWVMKTNHALSAAQGEYICFLHHDDCWLDGRLKIMKQLARQYPQVSILLHPTYYLDQKGNRLGLWKCPLPPSPQIIKPELMMERLLVQNFISIVAPIFKREAALKAGGMNEGLWYTADWDFWLNLASCNDTLYFPWPLSGFRIHPTSQTISQSSHEKDFRGQLDFVTDKYFALWEATPTRKMKLRKVTEFSNRVNTTLAQTVHGRSNHLASLLLAFFLLGPSGWHRYLRDSRILERVSARMKIGLTPSKAAKVK